MRVEVRAERLTPGGVLRTEHVQAIVDILVNRGGLALIPSDTCYSLAARPTGPAVSRRINRILDRKEQPISLAFDTVARVGKWVELNVLAARLLEYWTPGPITVVCRITQAYDPAVAAIADDVLAAPDRTIGVRIPDSHIERQLVSACEFPLTTVAVRNRSGDAVTDFSVARQIVEDGIAALGERVALAVVEGRPAFATAHSTVVRVPGESSDRPYDVIRAGALSTADLDAAANAVSRWEMQNLTRGGGYR